MGDHNGLAKLFTRTINWLGVLLLVTCIFFLAQGPLIYCHWSGYLSPDVSEALSATAWRPANWLCRHSDLYRGYMEWWVIRGIFNGNLYVDFASP